MYQFKPLSDEEARKWIIDYLGDSLVKTKSRTKFTANVIVRSEEGEREVKISLPRHSIDNYKT